MKQQVLLLSGAMMLTAAVSSTLAFTALDARNSQPQVILSQKQQTGVEVASIETHNSVSSISDFAHWRISFVDQSNRSPEFAQFLQQLRQAVQDRDAAFLRSIVTPQTSFGFGEHRSLSYLNPENPDSPIWAQLEKAIAPGCTDEANTTLPQPPAPETLFSCPTVFRQLERAVQNAPQTQTPYESFVAIVGEGVKVRSQPSDEASIVAILSNEIVQSDPLTSKSPQLRDRALSASNLNGWTAVVLPNGDRGYVSNRNAYRSLGYRAIFSKANGKWTLQAFVSGD